MREAFHDQLDSIFVDLSGIARQVQEAVAQATEALLEGNAEIAEQVISNDVKIDLARERVEDLAFSLLSLQQPVAGDLRTLAGQWEGSATGNIGPSPFMGTAFHSLQVTVADVRDGALSSSTLKEASSWGKVDTTYEQMVFSEATLAVPLIAGYAFHKRGWEQRSQKRFADLYSDEPQPVVT